MNPNNFISTDYLQTQFAKFHDYCTQRLGIAKPVITLTTLIFMFDLENSQNIYEAKLRSNSNSDNPNEIKLTDKHHFLPTHGSIAVQKYSTTSGGIQDGNFPFFTYADPNYFDGESDGLKETDALRLIWAPGATFTINQDGSDLVNEFSTSLMGYTPDSQYLTAGASGQPNDELPQYGPSYEERGYGRLYTEDILKGMDDVTLKLNLSKGNISKIAGGFDDQGQAVDTRNRAMIRLLGFRYTNALSDTNGKFCRV